MSILKQNTFAGGTDTSDITVANSGGSSGDAFDLIESTAGTTVTTGLVKYSSLQAYLASLLSMRTNGNSTNVNTTVGYSVFQNTNTDMFARFYMRRAAIPGVSFTPWRSMGASSALAGRLLVTPTTGLLAVQNAAGSTLATGSVAMPINSWTRYEMRIRQSTTIGEIECRWWSNPADTGTPTDTILATGAVLLNSASSMFFGQNSSNNLGDTFFAGIAVGDTDWLGPISVAPTAGDLIIDRS